MDVEGVVGGARNETTMEMDVCSDRVVSMMRTTSSLELYSQVFNSLPSRYTAGLEIPLLPKIDMDNFLAIFVFRSLEKC